MLTNVNTCFEEREGAGEEKRQRDKLKFVCGFADKIFAKQKGASEDAPTWLDINLRFH